MKLKRRKGICEKEKGITLVALVVTIVVLLILAGITINLILGSNSIFDMARRAGEETNQAVEDEQTGLNKLIEKLEEGNWGSSEEGPTNNGDTEVKISGISFPTSTVGVAIDGSITLKPNIEPKNASNKILNWTSENPDIVTVNENGIVTPIKVGEATIKVEATDGSEKTTTCKVTVIEEGAIPYSWEELGKIANAISNTSLETYNENTTEISVEVDGDTKTLEVGDWTRIDGRRVRILGFNHDTLSSSTAYGEETTSGRAGISFEYLDCLMANPQMDPANTNENGWVERPLYQTLNTKEDAKYKEIQEKGVPIKQVQKTYNATYNISNPQTSNDYLWLLSCSEIWGNSAYSGCVSGYSKAEEGKQYAFYANCIPKPECSTNNTNVVHYNSVGISGGTVWLRSPFYNLLSHFCCVSFLGKYDTQNASGISANVAPGFSI